MVRSTLRILAIQATMIPPDFEGMEAGGGVGKAVALPFLATDLSEIGVDGCRYCGGILDRRHSPFGPEELNR